MQCNCYFHKEDKLMHIKDVSAMKCSCIYFGDHPLQITPDPGDVLKVVSSRKKRRSKKHGSTAILQTKGHQIYSRGSERYNVVIPNRTIFAISYIQGHYKREMNLPRNRVTHMIEWHSGSFVVNDEKVPLHYFRKAKIIVRSIPHRPLPSISLPNFPKSQSMKWLKAA